MSMAQTLRALLNSPRVEYFMEAHDALSARIASEVGFPALWASSLAISTTHGVSDNNMLSFDEVLRATETIADASSKPVLLDADSGHGGPAQLQRVVARCEKRGIAGICIEDQVYPKFNSLMENVSHTLEPIERFAEKIRAAKAAQRHADFCVVARVESFIAGESLEQAVARAKAYRTAGADAILIHSRASTAAQVMGFRRHFDDAPVLIVPTTYAQTPPEAFADARFSAVIWANHMVRACMASMRSVASEMLASKRPPEDDRLAPVKDLLTLFSRADEHR